MGTGGGWLLSQFEERKGDCEVPRRERLTARPTLEELFAGAEDKRNGTLGSITP